jgi:O-antigen ligase
MAMSNFIHKLLLGVILLELPIQLDVYLGSPDQSEALGAIEGINVSVTTVCLAALYALWSPRWFARPQELLATVSRISPAAMLYPLAVASSFLVARDGRLVLCEFVVLIQAMLLYVYVAAWVKTRRDVVFVVTLLLVGLAVQAFIVIGLRGVGSTIEIVGVKARIDDNLRVGGTIGSPNGAGDYFAMLIPLSVVVMVCDVSRRVRSLGAAAFLFGGIAIVLTQSRGSWIALALALAIVLFETLRWGRINIHVPLAAAAVSAVLAIAFSGEIVTRLTADDRGAAYARIPLMKLTARIIADHPWMGVGASNFSTVAPHYAELSAFREIWLHAVHNKYLLVFAETGAVGFALLMWFMVGAVRGSWKVWAQQSAFVSPIALGIGAGITAHMVHMSVDILNGRPFVQIPWMLAGLVCSLNRILTDETLDRPSEESRIPYRGERSLNLD